MPQEENTAAAWSLSHLQNTAPAGFRFRSRGSGTAWGTARLWVSAGTPSPSLPGHVSVVSESRSAVWGWQGGLGHECTPLIHLRSPACSPTPTATLLTTVTSLGWKLRARSRHSWNQDSLTFPETSSCKHGRGSMRNPRPRSGGGLDGLKQHSQCKGRA